MASITRLTNSSSASSYSNANAITGLASGLDTEALIEQAVSSYEAKIASIKQDQTKVQWQQNIYRDIIEKIVSFSEKYTSYTSDTNLFSESFFNQAITTEVSGTYAKLVSASGKSDSAVSLLGVKQLATAATYYSKGDADGKTITGSAVDWSSDEAATQSSITGTLKLSYGDSKINLTFNSDDKPADAQEFADLVNEKLKDQTVTMTEGGSKAASEYVQAVVNEDGQVVLKTTAKAGSVVKVTDATGKIKNQLTEEGDDGYALTLKTENLTQKVSVQEAVNGQTLTFTLDGVSRSIKLEMAEDATQADFLTDLNKKLENSFGEGKIEVAVDANGVMTFSLGSDSGSTLAVSGEALKALGFSDATQKSYVDTGDTLEALLGAGVLAQYATTNEDGDTVYKFEINNASIECTADMTLKDLMKEINNSEEAGVTVSYSSLTNKFMIAADDTGSGGSIKINGGLAGALFGSTVDANGDMDTTKVAVGQDAIFSAEVNGDVINLTRSTNTIDLDGMKVTLKGTFGEYAADSNELADVNAAKQDAVTFESGADTEKITDAVKSMVNDYNELVKLLRESYRTQPLKNSSGKRYEPLTDDDRADMSEAEIKAYEEKAKTGILYADQDLSAMYNKLVSALSSNVVALDKIGITTGYSDGLTVLKLDEDTLAKALKDNPQNVTEVFTGTNSKGGLMGAIDTVIDQYGATTGATKGILVQKAGSMLAPATVNQNTLQSKINEYQELIEKWQNKLSDKVDFYTRQFSALEQLMAQMNSQSSTLSGLMGY